MLTQDVKNLDPYGRLVYFVKERESIRLKKESGKKKPWTDDVILQSYRFCNIRRQDDAVSRWLLENWYKPYFDHPNMVVACVLARHFNQPSTLKAIGFPAFKGAGYWPAYVQYSLQAILKIDGTVFNGAYIIRADGKFPNKSVMVFEETCQQFINSPPDFDFQYMEDTVNQLQGYRNIGSFMAGQIAADLVVSVRGEWKDVNTYAPMGPGSKRGMNRIHQRVLAYPLKQDQFLVELRELVVFLKKELPASITKRLCMMDFQNILCEMDKYFRCLLGEGRPKQNYEGTRNLSD